MLKIYAIYGSGSGGNEVLSIFKNDKMSNLKNALLIDDKNYIKDKKIKSINEFNKIKKKKFVTISLQDPIDKEKIYKKLINYKYFNLKHSSAILMKNSVVKDGYILYPFSIISNNAQIGKLFHLNYYSAVGHDCIIGDFVSFGPNVICCGNVKIKNNVLIGGGSIIRPGKINNKLVIGNNVTIAMGSVVFDSIPDNCTVMGNPAKIIFKKSK
jgi:sugar O-acyltransferase (sialic acid O-acetyltransferase NeuD family)